MQSGKSSMMSLFSNQTLTKPTNKQSYPWDIGRGFSFKSGHPKRNVVSCPTDGQNNVQMGGFELYFLLDFFFSVEMRYRK